MKIYAIIVTYNPIIDLLQAEYASLSNQVSNIVYIDNNSANKKSITEWSKDKANACFVWLEDNIGVSPAQNIGIKKALQDDDTTHVIFFDQDSVIEQDFIAHLYSAEQHAIKDGYKVGLTGPIYKAFGDDFLYPIRSIKNNRFIEIPIDSFDDYCLVSNIISSGSLIKREVIEEIGLLREEWFIGWTDHEYCFRAALKGYVSIQTKRSCMHHQLGDRQIVLRGRKIGLYSPFRRYFECRNILLIQKEDVFPKVFRNHYLKLTIGKFFISILYGPSRIKQLRYCLTGFYDGLNGKYGQCSIRTK